MNSPTRLLPAAIAAAIGLAVVTSRADINKEAGENSFSVGFSFVNLGTTEEITRLEDGVSVIFPKDEADVIELVLPILNTHRANRKARADAEFEGLNSAFEGDKVRNSTRKAVMALLSLDDVSPGFDAAFDLAVADVKSLNRQWREWSSDLLSFHLYNHATVEPYRVSETLIDFGEIKFEAKSDGKFDLTLSPRFMGQGIGLGTIDPARPVVSPFSLAIFNPAKPGHSAEQIAGGLQTVMATVYSLLDRMSLGPILEASQTHLTEALLLHEIEAQYFAPDAPRALTLGLARLHLFYYYLTKNGEGELAQWLPKIITPDIRDDSATVRKRLAALESLDPLHDASEAHETDFSRIIAFSLMQLAQTPDNGSPIFSLFQEKGINVPENGFDRESFIAALNQAYPESEKQMIASRDDLIARTRSRLDQRDPPDAGEEIDAAPESKPTTVPDSPLITERISKTIGDTTFTYPPSLEAAVLKIAPEWADGLQHLSETMRKRFGGNEALTPPVSLPDSTLENIQELGISATRQAADHFSGQTAMMANAAVLILRMFDGNDVEVWISDDLRQVLAEGIPIENVQLAEEGKFTYTFGHQLKFSTEGDSALDAMVKQMAELPAPPLYATAKPAEEDGDLSDAPLENQIAAIRKGGEMIDFFIRAADELSPEQLLGKSIQILDSRQSFFVNVHEVVETGLVLEVIASPDRRWFCDGMANLIAIRECEREFGAGAGQDIFESMFDPKALAAFADQVDLVSWQAVENDESNPSVAEAEGVTAAYYYYATLALQAATADQGEDFPARWIAKIRETAWNRTNAGTVLAAYRDLTGEDLTTILKAATASAPPK